MLCRRHRRKSDPICLATLALAALSMACMQPAKPPSESPPAGINEAFLDPSLDVDQYVERFEGESRAVYVQRSAIVETLGVSPGDVVADIGAGTGFFSFLLADAVGHDGRVQAVEISPRFLDHLRGESLRQGAANIEVIEGTRRSVMLPAGQTDLAFICDVYHHFESPMESLSSLHSAIKPGGELVVIEFHRVPGETPPWLLEHVRAGRKVFQAEIESAGFRFVEEITLPGLDDNYILRFVR